MIDTDELIDLRREMLRFARLQLRDDAAAEDAVQEALAAALAGQPGFSGQATLKTWVFSILRHKIIDVIRARSRKVEVAVLTAAEDEDEMEWSFETQFDARGHWSPHATPAAWGDPEAALREAEFWNVFEACLHHLPENTARVFMMREFLGFDVDEICRELAITVNYCHVILHRARNGLRRCLEQNWFTRG